VVPVHNEETFLKPCLDAVLAQDEPVHEIIVVNNDSIDGTAGILATYHDRVTVLDEPRQGVQHARTTGLNAATTPLIGRIDADTRSPTASCWPCTRRYACCTPGTARWSPGGTR